MLKQGFIFLSLLVCAAAYGSKTAEPFQPGKIITVKCKANAAQSYALYIPLKGNKAALPMIYCFDPHGDGSLPLKKYKALAEIYGFMLAGSNNSKNGNDWPRTESIWRNLSEDTRSRFKINEARVYTCGFSGGAKVASYVALQHPGIAGVIAGGAGLPDGTPAGNFNFSFTAIGGEGDMNLTDLVAINAEFDKTRTTHRIIIFDGKHEWAPEQTMNIAFMGLQLDAMRTGAVPRDNAFIARCVARNKARLDMYTRAGQLLMAEQECRLAMSLFEGLPGETSWFQQKAAALEGDPQYQQQRQVQQMLLEGEQSKKAEFMQHFQQNDNGYWMSAINDLKDKAKAKTAEGAMYQRLLAYLSLAFYSLSNHMINGNENDAARHFVELYKLADPNNSEAWYFSAILNARAHEARAAENDLLRAVENGFKDKPRLLQQPEFKNQSTPINFYRIESKMQTP
ncbi:MAG TPA: hypothetical protein VGM31_10640 [Puia sp.]|jgi:pimeloyl-ACP methyl ester carboxylesterase